MIPNRRRFALLLLPLLLPACAGEADLEDGTDATAATPTLDLVAEEQAIRDRVAAWQQAANESAEAFASFYVADGVLMPPNGPAAVGPEAIAQAMGPMFEVTENVTFEPLNIDIAASGDMAAERGRYTLTMNLPDGPVDDEGSYLVVWVKEGGQWMVAHDIFNSDLPAPGM